MPRNLTRSAAGKVNHGNTGMVFAVYKSTLDRPATYICNSGDYPLEARPKLAFLALRIISAWSILDTYVSRIFVALVGGNPQPALDIYLALDSANVRHDALKAAAKGLEKEQRKVLSALLHLYKERGKERHKIAHHLWGIAPLEEDAVLLMDPRHYIAAQEDQQALIDRAVVYEEADFLKALKEIEELSKWLHEFFFLIGPFKHRADELLARLKSLPEIHQSLSRLFPDQKKPAEEPTTLPPPPGLAEPQKTPPQKQ